MEQSEIVKAVYVIPLLDLDDEVGIVFLRRPDPVYASNGKLLYPAGILDLSGGGVDRTDENCQDVAVREFREEMGIPISGESLVPFATFRSVDRRIVAFYVYRITPEELEEITVSDEHEEFVIIKKSDLQPYVEDGQVLDVHGDICMTLLYGNDWDKSRRDIKFQVRDTPWWEHEAGRITRAGKVSYYK
ncbi:MAG: NUDIX domain-containing protein [Candidatus Dojkabacteria bacterium]|nr:NUDIX domain-containing protein [Candidatus Dojkabacteria bacterium]